MEELDAALLKASRNRAGGVDDIPTEAWQWLAPDNRKKLLDILNQALTAGHIPQEWRKALVVKIYKGKASTADPNNYRPISLLSTAYKLMARILQLRREKAIGQASTHSIWFPRRSFYLPTNLRFTQTTGKGGTHRRLPVCPTARLVLGI